MSRSSVNPPPERYMYTYRLVMSDAPLQVFISVEPSSGRATPGRYTFRLSIRASGVERELCDPHHLHLGVDPRRLEFVVLAFPGKSSIPTNSLYSLRVWLRVNGIDHRIFMYDDLWIGKDLDFNSISDASFARLKTVDLKAQTYHGYVGKALVTFISRWSGPKDKWYKFSLDYEAGGVRGKVFEDLKLMIDDPRTVRFVIYAVPIHSTPPGSSHRLRVWLKSPLTVSATDPASAFGFTESHVYQRIWKTDTFKIGARLDFAAMANKVILGLSLGPPQILPVSRPLPTVRDKT